MTPKAQVRKEKLGKVDVIKIQNFFIKKKCQSLSLVRLFVTPWTAAHQAPLSMEFFRKEYCSG